MRRASIAWALVSSVALSCGGDERESSGTSTPTGLTGVGATSSADDGATGDTQSADDGADGDKLDVENQGSAGDNPGDVGTGCEKVDLVFVIDDSGSMADEQINLVNSFPGFIDAMQTELAETSGYNVGVVTSDQYIYDVGCGGLSIGNLIARTGGPDSSDRQCSPYASGLTFMTEADDLTNKFSCAAQVGTGGDGDEHPMEALLTALSPELAAPGECNEGFLRDDALLVVVLITDEEDDHETQADACDGDPQPGSPGEPSDWFDDLVAIKGQESNVVILSLVGPDAEHGAMCPALDKCNGGIAGAEVADRILEFTRMFTFGFIGPVCEDYGPIFQESISVIKSACDEFDPPG